MQGWIKCGSGEHRSQEMTRRIEEIFTLGYEKKEGGRRKRRGRKEKEKEEKRKNKKRKKEEAEIEELTEEEEEHVEFGDDKLKSRRSQ